MTQSCPNPHSVRPRAGPGRGPFTSILQRSPTDQENLRILMARLDPENRTRLPGMAFA